MVLTMELFKGALLPSAIFYLRKQYLKTIYVNIFVCG